MLRDIPCSMVPDPYQTRDEREIMVKLTFILRRLTHLSREEFQAYWYDKHAPLVRKHKETLRIRRYVQTHTVDEPINDTLRQGRGGPEAYDGVAELWWDSMQDLSEAMVTPEGLEAGQQLLEDEQKFIDLAQSPLWISTERTIIES